MGSQVRNHWVALRSIHPTILSPQGVLNHAFFIEWSGLADCFKLYVLFENTAWLKTVIATRKTIICQRNQTEWYGPIGMVTSGSH